MGELLESKAGYVLNNDALKKLLRKEITVDDLTEKDLSMDIQQKGVDMKIGLDIACLLYTSNSIIPDSLSLLVNSPS